MVAKITIGSSLFGAIKYNADKVNEGKGQLLDTNKIFNAGNGKVDVIQTLRDFERCLPGKIRTEKPVIHVSLNPHPDDRLTDGELSAIAHEYMQRMGYGDQPYIVVKHEDIDRHHIHIVSLRVNEQGKCIDKSFNYPRSKRITRDIEQKYGLHTAERKMERQAMNPLRAVNPDEGDIKKQVGNTVKAVFNDYQFQTIGELRALLSLYNITVDEVRGNVRGEDFNGLVYSVIAANGEKVGNPFKSSLFGKSVGYEALQRKAAYSKKKISEKKLTEPTKKTLEYALRRTYDKDELVQMLKAKGIDCVFRYTDEGRLYGATFIDHRTHCVLNGSRMGKDFSANALERHFNTPIEEQHPFREHKGNEQERYHDSDTETESSRRQTQQSSDDSGTEYRPSVSGTASFLDALDFFNTDNPVTDAEEEAFRRKLQRKKKKRRGPKL
ncbi:MAG: relaxase/mobilization nuclease domain-containing protein [Prevotella sp.]|nr:relaxase/mobilization nuclease domain-containing protein [Prevotella sp.]